MVRDLGIKKHLLGSIIDTVKSKDKQRFANKKVGIHETHGQPMVDEESPAHEGGETPEMEGQEHTLNASGQDSMLTEHPEQSEESNILPDTSLEQSHEVHPIQLHHRIKRIEQHLGLHLKK